MDTFGGSWILVDSSMTFWRHFFNVFFVIVFSSIFVPTWDQLGPTWCQLGANLGQLGVNLGQVEVNLKPIWDQLGHLKLT